MKKSAWLLAGGKRWPGYVLYLKLVILLFWVWALCPLPVAATEEPASVELALPDERTPWVGQRMNFAVLVIVEGRFAGSTLFDLPSVPGAIIMKPEERPVLSTRTAGDKEYSVQRHEFSLFCQHGGEIAIPEIQVRCGAIKSFGLDPSEYSLHVPAFTIAPRIPKGAQPGQVIVSTTRLEVTETWNPRPEEVKVGDALKRTVSLQAAEVPGMLLPALPKPRLEGVAVYPVEPVVSDRTERGEFTGTRVDTQTYLCESSGTVEFPPVTYRWWNPEKSVWEERILPVVTLRVAANPKYASQESDAGVVAGSAADRLLGRVPLWWLGVLVVVLAVCVWLLLRRRQNVEARIFREVLQACQKNDAVGAYNAVTRWQSVEVPVAALPPQEVISELVSVQQVIVGLTPAWDGRKLKNALKSWRRAVLRREVTATRASSLPELNPHCSVIADTRTETES